jgi:amino acid transporter
MYVHIRKPHTQTLIFILIVVLISSPVLICTIILIIIPILIPVLFPFLILMLILAAATALHYCYCNLLYVTVRYRARKPRAQEKEALDIAFLLSPVVSLIMPTLTKDTAIIWWANAVAVAGCYAFAFLKPKTEGEEKSAVPEFISKGIKALDYGQGKKEEKENKK